MTAPMTTQPEFTPDNSAVLLIDHQLGTMSWVRSMPQERMRTNALALARAAKALGMPLILTSSQEDQVQGPLAEEFREIAPDEYAARIRRRGVVNALDDPQFAEAVRATGRTHLIVAGVTNDVCTVYPTLTARAQGYEVEVVADAGGSMSVKADDLALARMHDAGAVVASVNMALAGLARDWTSPAGEALVPILGALTPQ